MCDSNWPRRTLGEWIGRVRVTNSRQQFEQLEQTKVKVWHTAKSGEGINHIQLEREKVGCKKNSKKFEKTLLLSREVRRVRLSA